MPLFNPRICIVCTSSTAFLTSIAILITNEYISKSNIRYTKLGEWIFVLLLLYEKTLKQSMFFKKVGEKAALELKKIYNNYLDNRSKLLKKTQFKVEDIFGNVISKDSISAEQINKPNNFLAKVK